jgi:hypothetical protein
MLGSAWYGSWNRNPSIGKARAPPLQGGSGISFCISTNGPPCNAGDYGQGLLIGRRHLSRYHLSGVAIAARHGGHQTEKIILHEMIGFVADSAARCSSIPVAEDTDVVFSQFSILRRHVRSLQGTPRQPREVSARSEVNLARMNTGATEESRYLRGVTPELPSKTDLGLNRLFSVFVNAPATNPILDFVPATGPGEGVLNAAAVFKIPG